MANHRAPVPEWLTSDYMTDVIRKALDEPNITVKAIDVKPGSNVGDNYVCQIFRIGITFITNGEEKQISVIGKLKPDTRLLESLKDQIDPAEIEALFFSSLYPLLRNYYSEEDDFTPKCFHVDNERNLIIMEDLVAKGYELQPRQSFLNKKQCLIIVEALATLHGASHHAVEKDPTLKETYKKYLWSSEKNEPLHKLFENAQRAFDKFANSYGLSERYSKNLLGVLERVNQQFCKVCDLQDDRLNFLLHGDCWKSNMMFHYNDGVVDSAKLLDFQLVNYNSFANDLHYFLFSSVEAGVIVNNIDCILEHYYSSLIKIAPNIPGLTLARIKTEFAERYYFGYLMSLTFRPFLLSTTPPDAEQMMDGTHDDMGFNDPLFVEQLHQLLPFFEENGVF